MSITLPTASTVPNRTSGAAPLAVWFDLTGATSTQTSKPWRDLEVSWNYGDTDSGNYSRGEFSGQTRNEGKGLYGFHVFWPTSGFSGGSRSYTVTATVSDGVDTDTQQYTITVNDPDSTWSSTATKCYRQSATGTFDGAPSGAQELTESDINVILTGIASNERILLRRGDSWAASSSSNVIDADNWALGDFGSGAKPIINGNSSQPCVELGSGSVAATDGRIFNIEFNGNQSQGAVDCRNGTVCTEITIASCDFDTHRTAIFCDLRDASDNFNDAFAFYDCTATNYGTNSWGFYFQGDRVAIENSDISSGEGHNIRIIRAGGGVITSNAIGEYSNTTAYQPMKIHSLSFSGQQGHPAGTYTEKLWIRGNTIDMGQNARSVLGPQSNSQTYYDEHVRRCVVECCRWTKGSGSTPAIQLSGQEHVVRNNIFTFEGTINAVSIQKEQYEFDPDLNEVYNNTIHYTGSQSSATAISVSADGDLNVIANNLVSGPSITTITVLSDSGTNTSDSNNVEVDSPGWLESSPTSSAGYRLIDEDGQGSGSDVAHDDFFGEKRPRSGTIDIGASEFFGAVKNSTSPRPAWKVSRRMYSMR